MTDQTRTQRWVLTWLRALSVVRRYLRARAALPVLILGCTPLAGPRVGAAPVSDRCATLDDRSTYAAAMAAGGSALAGSGGLAGIAVEGSSRTALAVSAVVAGAVGAAAAIVAHESSAAYARECNP